MTQEQREKLDQSAETFAAFDTTYHTITGKHLASKRGYIAGAETILDNPDEWGLVNYKTYEHITNEWLTAKAESERYRKDLERIANANVILFDDFARKVAKEALKQEEQ